MNLTHEQIDTLKELINVGVGQAAEILNDMIPSKVQLQVPLVVPVSSGKEVESLHKNQPTTVSLGFFGAFSGTGTLALSTESASKLTTALTDEDPNGPGFDTLREEAITEVGNIVINGVVGSIGNFVQQEVEYHVPAYADGKTEKVLAPHEALSDTTDLMARTHFMVEQLEIEGDIVLSFSASSFDSLLRALETVADKV